MLSIVMTMQISANGHALSPMPRTIMNVLIGATRGMFHLVS